MPYAVFDQLTGICRAWTRYDPLSCDASEVALTLPSEVPVDPRTARWDGATGTRPATAAELAAYDAATVQTGATFRITADKDFQALVLCLIDGINVVRGKLVPALPAITVAQAKQAFIDKRKALG